MANHKFVEQPFDRAETVTPDDATNFTETPCDALYVGTTGTVTVVFDNDATQLFTGVPAGAILHVKCKRVNATGTGASNIVALYRARG